MTEPQTPGAVCVHPLAYLLAVEGAALMRAFAGEHDAAFIADRLAEVRRILDRPDEYGVATIVEPVPVADGYDAWSAVYDTEDNPLLDADDSLVRPLLDALPVGVALDAACGTGRHAAYLTELGHQVIGVDGSARMLAAARARLPDAELHEADLHALPLPDAHVDTVVCSLALGHIRDLVPVFAEFARVLRPGGALVVSDAHSFFLGARLYPLVKPMGAGQFGFIPNWQHETSDYLVAALTAGLDVVHCAEPRLGDMSDPDARPEPIPRDQPPDPFALLTHIPAAAAAAYRDQPFMTVWQFGKRA